MASSGPNEVYPDYTEETQRESPSVPTSNQPPEQTQQQPQLCRISIELPAGGILSINQPLTVTIDGTLTITPHLKASSTPATTNAEATTTSARPGSSVKPISPAASDSPPAMARKLSTNPAASTTNLPSYPAQNPTILLIHGAWHTPSHYYPLIHSLTLAGYPTLCPHLPTCSNTVPPTSSLSHDVAVIRATALDLVDRGHPIVAIMHSYGGVVGTEALAGLGWIERERAQHSCNGHTNQNSKSPGGVVALLYMCSFMLAPTASLATPFGGQLPPIMRGHNDGTCSMDDAWLRFYSTDVSPPPKKTMPGAAESSNPTAEQMGWRTTPFPGPPASSPLNPHLPPPNADFLMQSLTKHCTAAEMEPITAAAYQSAGMHVCYLVCERDMALPVAAQRGMIGQMRAQGFDVVEEVCEGGHSPFLSVPGEVCRVVGGMWQRWVGERDGLTGLGLGGDEKGLGGKANGVRSGRRESRTKVEA